MDESPHGGVVPVPAPDECAVEALEQFYNPTGLAPELEKFYKETGLGFRDALTYWTAPRVYHPAIGGRFNLILQRMAIAVAPALCTAIFAWLGSRNGRRVRIKIEDIEAEAQTREQVEELLARALEIQQEIQQRNQPPKIIIP